jgi:hypothetical protein
MPTTIIPVAISCLLNAILGGKRYEMLSSRSYRCKWKWAIWLIDGIFGKGHCESCYQFELDNFDGIQD